MNLHANSQEEVTMTPRDNFLKAANFEYPDYIPMSFGINGACWNHYPHEELYDLMEEHKFLFPGFVRPLKRFVPEFHPIAKKGVPFKDDWGCIWETYDDGITGTVTVHPLDSWDKFSDYKAPDPGKVMGIGPVDWEKEKEAINRARLKGDLIFRGLRHGHTFLQLCDIRGYENLLYDMIDDEPRLKLLINMVEEFNLAIVKKYLDMGVDVIGFAEDLGMQKGPMISPELFRKYIKPSYERLMAPVKDYDTIIHMHSDGDIRLLIDDLIDKGVRIINIQDLVNGIDWIAEHLSGKVCVELDIDRQAITAHGTPEQIDELIREEVQKLGSRQGGLMMIYGLYPGVPIRNVKAIMDAMEKYAFYYS